MSGRIRGFGFRSTQRSASATPLSAAARASPLHLTGPVIARPHLTPADFSIVNQPGAGSYPITGYS